MIPLETKIVATQNRFAKYRYSFGHLEIGLSVQSLNSHKRSQKILLLPEFREMILFKLSYQLRDEQECHS